VEPDRVIEVDPAHLGQRLLGIPQRPVQVDVRDQLGRVLGRGAGCRAGAASQNCGKVVDPHPHGPDVLVDLVRMEQMRERVRGWSGHRAVLPREN
jgi:hypothetical protein